MRRVFIAVIVSAALLSPLHARIVAAEQHAGDGLRRMLADVGARQIPSGILYDRVVPLSRLRDYDGTTYLPASTAQWRQMYFEMYRASLATPVRPALDRLDARVRRPGPFDAVPIAVMNLRYDRFRADALDTGALRVDDGRAVIESADALEPARVFAAAAMIDRTYRGGRTTFSLEPSWYFTNDGDAGGGLEADFDDGLGFRAVRFGDHVAVDYTAAGEKTIRLRSVNPGGEELRAAFVFRVESLQAPLPDDTIAVTATIPYNAEFGTGEAYVYLADGHAALTKPVVLVEGFDIDNTMNWDELYALLNDEGLVESVRAEGYDVVVLNFSDATDYIQKNSLALVELLGAVQAGIAPGTHYALVGASMGGLCSRYALSYMETHAIAHRVATYISFDTPHNGANIPLGIQYWLDFFQDESADAAALLASLDRPAARQMLAYHHTTPPGATGESDPLRAGFDADLAALGDYPSTPRRVAMANGSGAGATQGFNPGAQIIGWEYDSFLVDIRGNVWAVPDGGSAQILEGRISIIFQPDDVLNVSVSGTAPYDNAPGGWRSSMAQMDSTAAPYGDIVALHDNHCFIPAVSALDLATSDLFYDIDGDPGLLSITPFDAVYYPVENQPHVDVTPENAQWILDEIRDTPTGVRPTTTPPAGTLVLEQNTPNPFNPSTLVRFNLPQSTHVHVAVYDVGGALVATLVEGVRAAGPGRALWNGTDARGRRVGSGVYFCRLTAGSESRARKMVLVK
jgi:hypothetical protein